MKNLYLYSLTTLIIFYFSSCSQDHSALESGPELTKVQYGEALDRNYDLERREVRDHYRLQSSAFRKEQTLSEYHRDLSIRYNRVVKNLTDHFPFPESGEDPQLQMHQLRDSLLDRENVPLWYRDLRRANVERIIEIGNRKSTGPDRNRLQP